MRTAITVLHPDGRREAMEIDLPEKPSYGKLARAMRPFLGEYINRIGYLLPELMERLPALVKGEERDLVVCELGEVALSGRDPLPFNHEATKLHRAVTLAERPSADPDTLAKVCGPAVLFTDRKIWFEGEI